MLNATLECHVARPHALSHEVSSFIYIDWLIFYWISILNYILIISLYILLILNTQIEFWVN